MMKMPLSRLVARATLIAAVWYLSPETVTFHRYGRQHLPKQLLQFDNKARDVSLDVAVLEGMTLYDHGMLWFHPSRRYCYFHLHDVSKSWWSPLLTMIAVVLLLDIDLVSSLCLPIAMTTSRWPLDLIQYHVHVFYVWRYHHHYDCLGLRHFGPTIVVVGLIPNMTPSVDRSDVVSLEVKWCCCCCFL